MGSCLPRGARVVREAQKSIGAKATKAQTDFDVLFSEYQSDHTELQKLMRQVRKHFGKDQARARRWLAKSAPRQLRIKLLASKCHHKSRLLAQMTEQMQRAEGVISDIHGAAIGTDAAAMHADAARFMSRLTKLDVDKIDKDTDKIDEARDALSNIRDALAHEDTDPLDALFEESDEDAPVAEEDVELDVRSSSPLFDDDDEVKQTRRVRAVREDESALLA